MYLGTRETKHIWRRGCLDLLLAKGQKEELV